MFYKKLEWDTNFFSFPVYKITNNLELEELEKTIHILKNKCCFVYYFSNSNNKIPQYFLNKYNGLLINRKVDLEQKIQNKNFYISEKIKKISTKFEKKNKLENVFIQSGIYSRFNLDKRINHNYFIDMYKIWFEKAFENKSYITFSYEDKGLIVLKNEKKHSIIEIISVDKQFRGKNIGSKLIDYSKKYLLDHNILNLSVSTQLENKNAISFYLKNGFQIKKIYNTYHFDFRKG